MKVKASYFNGITADRQEIDIFFAPTGLIFPMGDMWLYDDLKLMSRDQSTGQLMYENKSKPGPGITLKFEQGMEDPARDYLSRISKKLTGDSSWHFVRWQIVTSLAIVGLLFLFYLGYPFLNQAIVSVIPNSWAVKAGDIVVDSLYQNYASNVCSSPSGDKALNKLLSNLEVEGLPYPLRVEVVQNQMVNAFTTPGGRIVIFRGLIEQAESAEEIMGVLTHEVGHVYYQHPLQGLVNVLGFSIVGSFMGGDAASIAIVGLSLSYSRELERQADDKALDILLEQNISASGLVDFFERQQEKNKTQTVTEFEDLFSTHPMSEERINTFKNHIISNEKNNVTRQILSVEEWGFLKNICSSRKDENE